MIRLAAAIAMLALPALVHAQALEGTLKKIRDTKTINIAYRTDAIPFSFSDGKSTPTGYTVDICKRVVASLEQQLKIQGLQVNWVPATSQNRLELVAKKQADMECGSTTATLSRMETVDFSSFVFVDGTGVLVRNDAGVKNFADLGGKRVAVIAGTTNEKALREAITKGSRRSRRAR
jgi:ABC-type amino acid transport substrate-binding protein